MRDYVRNALKKFDKLTREQLREVLLSAADELDLVRSVVMSVGKGLAVCDGQHILIKTNSQAERLLGIDARMEGIASAWTLVRDKEISGFLRDALFTGCRVDDREFFSDRKGVQRLLNICVLPLVSGGHVSGSLITVEDITEKRRRETKFRQTENLASLTTLAAGVAHEIKNPLTSLSIHTQLIQKLLNNAKTEEHDDDIVVSYTKFNKYTSTINEEIQRLNQIVVDFLFAVRPMEIFPVKSDINELIMNVVKFVHYELREKNITYELKLGKNIPVIEVDKKLLKQALLNLIKNAIEAMPDSGGNITVSTEADELEARISVSDNGIGIAETDIGRIFEPYFTTKERGTGLGLTLVFKIVREHSGEIDVVSKPGKGACFTIKLPLPRKDGILLDYIAGQSEKAC
ncbi:MAG: ATP-binding protein [Spirochaetaceae bacterium]|jgi:PAS domain S-box-containing protein|nr:ATP-binding protein [Spirochaetaceae bacterium]